MPPSPTPAAAPRLTVVGSINLDLVARCERLPRPGETVSGATFERHPGGKGANQAVAAARLGADVRFIGCLGDDDFAPDAVLSLEEAQVDTESVVVREAPTGVALILVDARGENQIVVAPGANALLRPEDVRLDGEPVLTQLEIPPDAVVAAAAQGPLYVNAAPARPIPAEVYERAELVIVNRHEYELLPGAAQLRRVALTLGAEGAVLLEGGEEVARAAPPPVQPVDGTAAGDAFTAALVISHLEGRSWESGLRRACAAGALAASRRGAQPSLPTAAEVDAVLAA